MCPVLWGYEMIKASPCPQTVYNLALCQYKLSTYSLKNDIIKNWQICISNILEPVKRTHTFHSFL